MRHTALRSPLHHLVKMSKSYKSQEKKFLRHFNTEQGLYFNKSFHLIRPGKGPCDPTGYCFYCVIVIIIFLIERKLVLAQYFHYLLCADVLQLLVKQQHVQIFQN